jgi:LDH2 family malate/lactate/ureidoglycolate dehydrogenase
MSIIEVESHLLKRIIIDILINERISCEDAELVADSLVDAEIRELESHGLMRLPSYVERIKKNLINIAPKINIISEFGSIIKIDGDNGLGQVVTEKSFELCMNKAEKTGVSVGAIKNTNHFGTAGYFTRIASDNGYIAFASTNASATMPPFGGIKPYLGTNPFSVSFPAGKYGDFTLDIAMSSVSRGKIRMYDKKNISIPIGWAMDIDGNDTTDPKEALKGGLLPMAGHKGYGIAIIIDMLCGIIAGANLSYENGSMFSSEGASTIGNFIGVMKIDSIMERSDFEKRVEAWFDIIKSSPKRPNVDEIYIPGEKSNNRKNRNEGKVSILDKTFKEIEAMWKKVY